MPKVELLTYTPDADKVVAAAAKLCYAKTDIDTLLDNLTPEKTEDFLFFLEEICRSCLQSGWKYCIILGWNGHQLQHSGLPW